MLAVAVLTLSGCDCYKKMAKNQDDVQVVCTPEVLVLNNGTIEADVTVKFPVKYFNAKAVVKVTPVIVFEGGEVAGAAQYFQGTKVQDNYTVIQSFGVGAGNESVAAHVQRQRIELPLSGNMLDGRARHPALNKLTDALIVTLKDQHGAFLVKLLSGNIQRIANKFSRLKLKACHACLTQLIAQIQKSIVDRSYHCFTTCLCSPPRG